MMEYLHLYENLERGGAGDSVPRLTSQLLWEVAAGNLPIVAIRHPLGFVCLPVLRQGGRGICVHFWTSRLAQAHPTTSAVHAHSWDLVSYVLFGQVRNQVVRVSGSGPRQRAAAGAVYRVFEVHSRGDLDEIHATSRLVNCHAEAPQVSSAGETYSVPAGTFHATDIPAGLETATVALGTSRAGSADLSLGAVATPTHRVRRQQCDSEETSRVARMIAGRLAGKRSA
jgi:hypothetical protein